MAARNAQTAGPATAFRFSTIGGVPGPPGPPGPAGPSITGPPGATGANSFTTLTSGFTQPAQGLTVTINVVTTAWMIAGQNLFIQGGGYYSLSSITNATQAVVNNLGSVGNAIGGTAVSNGGQVGPAGPGLPQAVPISLSIVTVTATGGIINGRATVLGTPASPYAAQPGQLVQFDTSQGSVAANMPALASGQWVSFKHDGATVLSGAVTVTINKGSGLNLEQQAPANGTFLASTVWNAAGFEGANVTYYNGGSPSGYSTIY